jgi:hypothetical protein
LCGITPAEAAQLSLVCRPRPGEETAGGEDDLPAYEVWRRNLAGALTGADRR